MKLITERTQAREVSKRWDRAYPKARVLFSGDDTGVIGDKLRALNVETATASDIAAIIGNASWCGPSYCDECGNAVPAVVQVGEAPDYESSTALICAACLEKALALAREASA